MKKRNLAMLVALLSIATITVSLTGRSSKSSYSVTNETMAAAGEYESSSDMEGSMLAKTAPDSSSTSGNSNGAQTVRSNRKLIRIVDLSVETTTFNELTSSITSSVSELGGYIERSNVSGNSISTFNTQRYADMVIRMPVDKLDLFLTQVAAQGNIVNHSEQVEDVTLQYSDIESRKKSLTIEQDRIWALLEKADTLESVIALESRLSEIRYELESFESQLRLYDNQVEYSTLSINISEVNVFTPTAPDSVATRIQKGFSRNLSNVGNELVNLFVWTVSMLPILLPLIAIIGTVLLVLRRKKNNTKTKKEDGDS